MERHRVWDHGRAWKGMMRDAYTHIFFNHANWTIGARAEVHNVCGQTAPADGTELFCNNQGRAQLHQAWME